MKNRVHTKVYAMNCVQALVYKIGRLKRSDTKVADEKKNVYIYILLNITRGIEMLVREHDSHGRSPRTKYYTRVAYERKTGRKRV